MPAQTMVWYDYDTTGADPVRDRPLQFAAWRTSLELDPVDDPVVHHCALSRDVLPQPIACLITGLAPQDAERDGLIEAEFAAAVHAQLAEPGTCSAGYNSIRFDDTLNRNLFYRNFFDPYEHGWRSGNSRWDIIDLARMCYALRPAGIEWPRREDGAPSFKLEHLATANRLDQRRAHDALSDVEATLGLARLLRTHQPRLYDWCFRLRDKRKVWQQFDLANMTPLLHVSEKYPAARGCLAVIVPLAEHPLRNGEIIVADLGADPAAWIDLDADAIAERLYVQRADLPEDVTRPPLKTVRANRAPALAPLSALKDAAPARIGLDVERCLAHAQVVRGTDGLRDRVRAAFALADSGERAAQDPELALYDGFASNADQRRIAQVRATPPAQLGSHDFRFDDARYVELLFRYRARNWPHTLDAGERERWRDFVRGKLNRPSPLAPQTLGDYFAEIARLRHELPPGGKQVLLDRLEAWGHALATEIEPPQPL